MMTSVLVSPKGYFEYEAARHSTASLLSVFGRKTDLHQSVATIFAWSGALRKRGELDGNAELEQFADKLEQAVLTVIESGKMTKDLAAITTDTSVTVLNSLDFIKEIRKELEVI